MKKLFIFMPLFFLFACTSHEVRSENSENNFIEKMFSVPITEENGQIREIQTRVCLPIARSKQATIVILNHGSPATKAERLTMSGYACKSEAAQWFLSRGYLVASPIRRGYGISGGTWMEDFGACDDANFIHAGLETARDIQAAIHFLTKLTEARPDHVIIVGQSAGGWGTIALNSLPHEKVSAFINMAGGRGGHKDMQNNNNCSSEHLVAAAAEFGKTSTTPMLWIYSDNDTFFDPPLAKRLNNAFIEGGGKTEFVQKPPFGKDGHYLFSARGGSQVWGADIEDYLASF